MKENSISKKKTKATPVQLIDQDEQKTKNFNLIGKMFGNLTESINVNNKDNIKNNSSNKFSGGFKKDSVLKTNKYSLEESNTHKQKQQKQSKMDVFTVYDEFGLINDSIGKKNKSNSKGKPKYRDDPHSQFNNQSSNAYMIQQSSVIDQMKDNRRQQFQQVMSNNYVNLHEYYDLSKQKGRQQTVIHVQSSLDNMTLDNVQAKLQAHRRQLKVIQDQYRIKKGILPQISQEQNASSFSPNKTFVKTGQNDLYKQYGKSQSQIYQLIKKNQKDDQKQIQIDHMWEEKLKQNPKIYQYSKKYQEYLVQKDAKNLLFGTVRQNLFKWEKYKTGEQPKSKSKIIQKSSKSRQKSLAKLNRSYEKFQQQAQLQKSSLQLTNVSQVLASKDDRFIAKYIFAQIDVDKKGLLSKDELLDYITKTQHIIKSYDIDLKWIYTDLDNFETKRKGMLNREQLGIFLATFQRISHPEIKLKNVSDINASQGQSPKKKQFLSKKQKKSPFQIFFPKDLYRFKNLFSNLDLNQDHILKRQQFIQNVFIDPQCSKIINNVAIRIKIIQKQVTYRQMISFILDDYRNEKNEKLKKSKQYITFGRFCEYFEFPETINLKMLGAKKSSKKNQTSFEAVTFNIDDENMQILKDLFDTIPRVYQDFIVAADFIQIALLDPLVLSFQEELCRIQSVQTDLPIETVRLTLQRMIKQCDQYIDWETAKAFFSQRGRPIDWNGELIKKKKAIRQDQRAQSINEVLKKQLIMKNQFEISAKMKSQYQSKQKRTSQNNYTIPQPFKITDQLKSKQQSKKIQQGQSQFAQLSKTFKAKPVNKQILQSKPHLIQGKLPSQSSVKKPQYNYENYENDRIQRALKKAQQKYELQQQKVKIKQMTVIKAHTIGIDLLGDWKKIYDEDRKKQKGKNPKQNQEKPLTQQELKIIQRMHPDKNFEKDKLNKLQEKKKKMDEISKMKKKQLEQRNNQLQQNNKKHKQKVENIKKQQQLDRRQRQKAAADSNQTFKPAIKPKKPMSKQQQQKLDQQKQQRNAKQLQQVKQALRLQQQNRRRILQRQMKDPYLKYDQAQQKGNDFLLQKIYSINLLDLMIDDEQRREFNQEHDFQSKDRKQREKYLKGVAAKFRIVMDKEENVLKELKIRDKQAIQKEIIAPKDVSSVSDKKLSGKLKKDTLFHQSKALKRYRQLINNVAASQIPSQYDRYTQQDFDQGKKTKPTTKILQQSLNQDLSQEENEV